MPKNNEELSLTLKPIFVGKSFPAIWEGIFNRLPKDNEGRANQSKIRKIMNDDLADKVANNKATSGFKLHFDWKKTPNDPRRIFLKVTAERPVSKDKDNGGQETPPTPKSPPPPPQ